MDGLRPYMIILMTASFSSETNEDAHWLEMCVSGRMQSVLSVSLLFVMRMFVFLGWLVCSGSLPAGSSNTSTTVSHIERKKFFQSCEIFSASVLLCNAAV